MPVADTLVRVWSPGDHAFVRCPQEPLDSHTVQRLSHDVLRLLTRGERVHVELASNRGDAEADGIAHRHARADRALNTPVHLVDDAFHACREVVVCHLFAVVLERALLGGMNRFCDHCFGFAFKPRLLTGHEIHFHSLAFVRG